MSKEFIKFIISGVVNTTISFLVFLVLESYLKLGEVFANLFSYIVGLISAYLMNVFYVFTGCSHSWYLVVRFLMAFVCAYSANLLVFLTVINLFKITPVVAQLLGMVAYTAVFFIVNKTVADKIRTKTLV